MMEQITLDMIPNSHTPIAHISQYDSGRHIRFNLQNITLTGSETVTLKIRKTDGELVSKTIENHTSYVEYVSEKADCDVSGKANSEIVISKDDVVIGSKNFILNIEADPYDNAGVVTETASGQIATFETNMVDVLQEVKCEINATGGNGTPDNPIAINGFTEAKITRCGVNLWDETWDNCYWNENANGVKVSNASLFGCNDYITVCEGTNIRFISPTVTPKWFVLWYDENKDLLSYVRADGGDVLTVPANACYMTFYNSNTAYNPTYNNDISILYPSDTTPAYHAYNGNTYTIAFGQTVYGGVLDVTRGKLHVTYEKAKLSDLTFAKSGNKFYTRAFADSPTGASFTDNFLCSIFKTVNKDWQHLLNGECCLRASLDVNYKWSFVFCSDEYETVTDFLATLTDDSAITYELATPFDIDLTPVQIEALLGVNNVWHDGNGDTEVKYLYDA